MFVFLLLQILRSIRFDFFPLFLFFVLRIFNFIRLPPESTEMSESQFSFRLNVLDVVKKIKSSRSLILVASCILRRILKIYAPFFSLFWFSSDFQFYLVQLCFYDTKSLLTRITLKLNVFSGFCCVAYKFSVRTDLPCNIHMICFSFISCVLRYSVNVCAHSIFFTRIIINSIFHRVVSTSCAFVQAFSLFCVDFRFLLKSIDVFIAYVWNHIKICFQ